MLAFKIFLALLVIIAVVNIWYWLCFIGLIVLGLFILSAYLVEDKKEDKDETEKPII